MNRRILLDTSAFSHFRAGHDGVMRRLDDATEVIMSTVVLGELHAAYRGGARFLDNEAMLERWLEEPFVVVRDVDAAVASRYGEVFAQLKKAARPIPSNDVWIAATALEAGAHLLSFDGDFRHVTGLSWTHFKS